MVEEWRKYKCGGQISASNIASASRAFRYPKSNYDLGRIQIPDTRLITQLAVDLGYEYIDRAGRKHLYFAYGDVPEIKRRVAMYKAIHGPAKSEIDYKARLEAYSKAIRERTRKKAAEVGQILPEIIF